MKNFTDRWFWRIMSVVVGGALWVIAMKLPSSITSEAHAGMKKKESYEKYPLNRMEYAQLLLNTHPYMRILTPHLTSEFLVTEESVLHQVTYDKTMWQEKKIENLLNDRHKNAVSIMNKKLGFEDFELADIETRYVPY